MAEESVEHETAEGNSKRLSSFASEDDVEKMREMIVIPECVISSPKTDTLNEILLDTIEFFSSKITDCEKVQQNYSISKT
jgi:hypothetical protein